MSRSRLCSPPFKAPLQLEQRQIGNVQCNVNRLQIVGDLTGAKSTAQTLTTDLASLAISIPTVLCSISLYFIRDPASSQLMDTINQGISDAQDGISQIASALFTGQQAPAEDRDQVASGLGSAIDAAGSLTS